VQDADCNRAAAAVAVSLAESGTEGERTTQSRRGAPAASGFVVSVVAAPETSLHGLGADGQAKGLGERLLRSNGQRVGAHRCLINGELEKPWRLRGTGNVWPMRLERLQAQHK
jgi:hypothetical protein